MTNEKRLIDANYLVNKGIRNCPIEDGGIPLKDFHQHQRILALYPTVDAVEVEEVREFARDVAYQFGYYCQNNGRLCITHGGLSTLEWAFDILGWENPHPVPECECEFDGCHEHATCGTPTKDGYKRVCGKHFSELQKEA